MGVNKNIQKAFLDGIDLVYSIMFTPNIKLSFLDMEHSEPIINSYGEIEEEKNYINEVEIVGKIINRVEKGEMPVEDIDYDIIVSVPTKEFIKNDISFKTLEDLNELKKAKLEYEGISYSITKVVPKTLVADVFQVYDLFAQINKNTFFTE